MSQISSSAPIPSSPFDDALLDLSNRVWTGVDSLSVQERDRYAFLSQQLGLLRETYLTLREASLRVKEDIESIPPGQAEVSFEVAVLVHPRWSRQLYINYDAFINILCQMSRVLPEHFSNAKPIPSFMRIRFYRNKTVEHWDAYTANIGKIGFVFKHGKAAIPAIERIVMQADRISALKELKAAFLVGGVPLVWPDNKAFSLVGTDPEYSEAVGARQGSCRLSHAAFC